MSDAKQVLVVAISTVGGPALGQAVLDRHQAGDAQFHVLVPERLPNQGSTWTTAQVEQDAQKRLDLILDLVRDMDVEVDGEVTRLTDAADAIDVALEERDVDEIVVVQGSKGLKKLADKHRVKRLDKEVEVPVTQIDPDDASDECDYDPEDWSATLQAWADAVERSPETD